MQNTAANKHQWESEKIGKMAAMPLEIGNLPPLSKVCTHTSIKQLYHAKPWTYN